MGARRMPPRHPYAASLEEVERVRRIGLSRQSQAMAQSLSDLYSLQRELDSAAEGKLTDEGIDSAIRRAVTRLGLRSQIVHLSRVSLELEITRIRCQLQEAQESCDGVVNARA